MGEIIKSNKKSIWNYKTSISFLVLVVIITASLYFYNNIIWNEIEKLKNEIITYENSIKEVEADKRLQIYSLLELNKNVIMSYEQMNNVTAYINHMKEISREYNLEFNDFKLEKGEIDTNVKIISDKKWIAFQKTRDFIDKYRLDPKGLFELKFINSIEWMDDMKFRVNFKIK